MNRVRMFAIVSALCFLGCGRVLGVHFDDLEPRRDIVGDGGQAGATGSDLDASIPSEGGSPAAGGCSSHEQCIEDARGAPALCRAGRCVALTTPSECPVLLGGGRNLENLRAPDPIVFGAYVDLDPEQPRISVPSLNYELAIEELNTALLGGLSEGSERARRPFMAVLCDGAADDLGTSLSHLIDDLGVAAILGPQNPRKLSAAFEAHGRKDGVFFLDADAMDAELASLDDDALVWGLRGTGRQLAGPYAALVQRAELLMQDLRSQSTESEDPLRLALIVQDDPVLHDVAAGIEATVLFNDQDAAQNEAAKALLRLDLEFGADGTPDFDGVADDLLDFAPHLILSLAGGRFGSEVVQSLEDDWPATHPEQVPPFYLLAPDLEGDDRLLLAATFVDGLAERMLGVQWAEPANVAAYEPYLSRLRSTYGIDEGARYYDAAYYLMYAIAGAGHSSALTGAEVTRGMERLIAGDTRFDVGPSDAAAITSFLLDSSDSTLELDGTQGPPTFDPATGVRPARARVWCVGPTEDGSELEFKRPAMGYEASTEELTGSQSCVPDF